VVRIYKHYKFAEAEYQIGEKLNDLDGFIDLSTREGSQLSDMIDDIRDLLDELRFKYDDLEDAFVACKAELQEVRNGQGQA
jgi:predicted  nucleic acid-binding Zn-ribbon protein